MPRGRLNNIIKTNPSRDATLCEVNNRYSVLLGSHAYP